MNDTLGRFVLMLMAIIVAGLLVAAPFACTMHENQLIANAISKGNDPIAVRCALESSGSSQSMCMVRAAATAGMNAEDIRCLQPGTANLALCAARQFQNQQGK